MQVRWPRMECDQNILSQSTKQADRQNSVVIIITIIRKAKSNQNRMNNEKFTNLLAQDNNFILNSGQDHLETIVKPSKCKCWLHSMHSAVFTNILYLCSYGIYE